MSFKSPQPSAGLRAYVDPVIFRDDRVLRTLLRKEHRYVPPDSYFTRVQTEVKSHMRKKVADWMLEVCQDQGSQPEVFVLAMNYFDRFLGLCAIGRSQLQLLGAVCLLVAWKVREHEPLPAARLVEYSDCNLTLMDIMEWEVLLLSKLDWDMSAVIASDFVEHIIQRVRRLHRGGSNNNDSSSSSSCSPSADLDPAVVRSHSEALITMCSAHHSFSGLSPSLVAAAAVLTTLRPMLEASHEKEEAADKQLSLDTVLDEVEKFTLIDKVCVREVMDRIEALMSASLPPSPAPSPPPARIPSEESKEKEEGDEEDEKQPTPTKVLDVDKRDCQ